MNSIVKKSSTIYYDQLGDGAPIIFIHPPGMGRRVFDYQKKLSNYFRIILPDLSGHGDSRSSNNGPIIKRYVDEIRMILDEERIDQVIIFGYSAGGMIAQDFVLSYPNRVSAIILSGGYPKVDSVGLALQYKVGMSLFRRSADFLAKILAFSHTFDLRYQKVLYDHMKKSDLQTWYQFYEETLHYDCTKRLEQITVPLLTVYGANAYWINKHKIFYNQLSNAKIATVTNSFHQVPTKKWHALNHLIRNFIDMKL